MECLTTQISSDGNQIKGIIVRWNRLPHIRPRPLFKKILRERETRREREQKQGEWERESLMWGSIPGSSSREPDVGLDPGTLGS